MTFPFIQIAGVKDYKEAAMLVSAGATCLGFPFGLDIHQEDLTTAEAAEIIAKIKDYVDCCLITYLKRADEISSLLHCLNTNILQLHSEIEISEIRKLKDLFPKLKIIKSIIIKEAEVNNVKHISYLNNELVDVFLTDTYDKVTGASGATGKTHNWEISRDIVMLSKKPVILAGGLNAENVAPAIKFVKPYGVDAHSLLEDISGRKSEVLAKKFIDEARHAFYTLEINSRL